MTPVLELRAGPFLRQGRSARALMWEVVLATVPVLIFATYHFGPLALVTTAVTCLGALLGERGTAPRGTASSLRDGSALLTGILLALTLPPSFPLWMAFIGGLFSTAVGKMVFGGLGHNPFNPALVGRAFLQAAFPTAITTWTAPAASASALSASVLSLPLASSGTLDAISAATPLALAKFEHELTALTPLLWGNTAGCLGETSAVLLLSLGLWLGVRRVFDPRLCVSTLLSVLLFSTVLHFLLPERCPPPLFMGMSGGLLFASVFMVTDPVTSPVTARGAYWFGAGVGALVVLIRVFGGLPEGVMYSVLLMNAITPLLDRYTQPRPFGATVRS